MRPSVLWTAVLALACGSTAPAPDDLKLVQDLSMLAHARPAAPDDAARAAAALADGRLDVESYVDLLLDSDRLGASAKSVVLHPGSVVKAGQPVPRVVMRHFEDEGTRIYTVGKRCTLAESETVHPWWYRGDTIQVCPHAHRPEVRTTDDGRMCGATTMLPGGEEGCGCGPRLMWCARDTDHRDQLLRSLRDEIHDTIAYVVNTDLPLEQLFLMNATVRDRSVESLYRRAAVAEGADPAILDAKGFRKTPRLAPRDELVEGQHAGILTSAGLAFTSDALRGVMREYYDFLWCARTSSSGVTTERVLGLGVVDLRVGDGWQQLASMDICTDCHARLDYGMQFFRGYPSSTMGVDFRASNALSGSGPLYGAHIGDPRGVDQLSPQGFARIVLTQPEFGACMAQKVTDHVLGDRASADDRDAVLLAFQDEHTYKAMMRTALLRYADHARDPALAASAAPAKRPARPGLLAPSDSADTGPDPHAVELDLELAQAVDNHCAHCHDGIDNVDLTGPRLPRATVNLMLEQVAFGSMPLGSSTFDADERTAFVDAAVDVLWADPEARAEARAFFQAGQRAHTAHAFQPASAAVRASVDPGAPLYIRSMQSTVPPAERTYSPGMSASMGLVALDACRDAGHTGSALADCVRTASDPARVISGGVE